MIYIPSTVFVGTFSLGVAKEADLTITKFRPGTERDLETLAEAAPICKR